MDIYRFSHQLSTICKNSHIRARCVKSSTNILAGLKHLPLLCLSSYVHVSRYSSASRKQHDLGIKAARHGGHAPGVARLRRLCMEYRSTSRRWLATLLTMMHGPTWTDGGLGNKRKKKGGEGEGRIEVGTYVEGRDAGLLVLPLPSPISDSVSCSLPLPFPMRGIGIRRRRRKKKAGREQSGQIGHVSLHRDTESSQSLVTLAESPVRVHLSIGGRVSGWLQWRQNTKTHLKY